MVLEKFDPVWAEDGTLDTTVTDAKIQTGWISGASPDRPTIELFNLLQNRVENKINEIVERIYTGIFTDDEYDVIKQVFPSDRSFCNPQNTGGNKIAISTRRHIDCAICLSSTGNKLFIVNNDDNALDIVSLSNYAVDSTLTCSGNDFSLPVTASVLGVSCCSDENYLYMLFSDASNFYLHSYDFDMQPNPNWPATGISWSRGAFTVFPKVRIASDDYLMINDTSVDITSGSSAGIRVYGKADGTYVGAGSGDTTLSTGTINCMTSDGTYAYFCILESPGEIASMPLSTPGATGRGDIWPILSSAYGVTDMCIAGDMLILTHSHGTSSDKTLTVYDGINGAAQTIYYNTTYVPSVAKLGTIISDGLHFYSRGYIDLDTSYYDHSIVKINIRSFRETLDSVNPVDDGFYSTYSLDRTSGLTYSQVGVDAPMAFDGRDLWVVGNNSSTTTDALQGFVYRIAFPHLR